MQVRDGHRQRPRGPPGNGPIVIIVIIIIIIIIAYEQQMIIKTYRQELRDFINNNKKKILNGEKVDFPVIPEFIDLNIIY